jgi:uncharacterized protein YecE (DUF72 family)
MRVIAGTSGFSYKEWKGTFYPEELPAAKMLAFYARHFGAVEINSTYYQMPKEPALVKWAGEVPEDFTFVLKAPVRIVQQKDLARAGDDLRRFLGIAQSLGPGLGPILFRADHPKDLDRLRALLSIMSGHRVALEARHDSWLADDVYDVLRERDVALCAADTDDVADPESLMLPTASWGYLRLRRTEYSDAELRAWADRVRAQAWTDAYVFFRHEDTGTGPAFAKRFLTFAGVDGRAPHA